MIVSTLFRITGGVMAEKGGSLENPRWVWVLTPYMLYHPVRWLHLYVPCQIDWNKVCSFSWDSAHSFRISGIHTVTSEVDVCVRKRCSVLPPGGCHFCSTRVSHICFEFLFTVFFWGLVVLDFCYVSQIPDLARKCFSFSLVSCLTSFAGPLFLDRECICVSYAFESVSV